MCATSKEVIELLELSIQFTGVLQLYSQELIASDYLREIEAHPKYCTRLNLVLQIVSLNMFSCLAGTQFSIEFYDSS